MRYRCPQQHNTGHFCILSRLLLCPLAYLFTGRLPPRPVKTLRFDLLIKAFRSSRREFAVSDSINLVQNRDFPNGATIYSVLDSSEESATDEGPSSSSPTSLSPLGVPPADDDGYNLVLRLGPSPEDWTVRIKTGHGKGEAVNHKHLERCFTGACMS